MRLVIIIFYLFFLSFNVFSQEKVEDPNISPFWDFYAINYVNGESPGKGNTGLSSETGISGINLNPASLNIENKYQFNIQYSYKTNQRWLENVPVEDIYLKNAFPSSNISFGYRINKNFQTGFSYNNPLSFKLSIGNFYRTNEFGNIIDSTDGYVKYVIHAFLLPIVYNSKRLNIGVNLSYNMYMFSSNIFTTEFNPEYQYGYGQFNRFNIQLGFLVKPVNDLSIGASFTPGFKNDVTYTLPGTTSSRTFSNIPLKTSAGVEIILPYYNLRISAEYNFVQTSGSKNLRDRHNVNIGVQYRLNSKISMRGGFFTLLDYRKDDPSFRWLDPVGKYNQYFLTAGAGYKVKNFIIDASILDSHISSGIIKNTYFHTSLTYNF